MVAVEEWRDWASLPEDIVRIIINKLSQTDILGSVGPWRRLALEEPLLWRHIDLGYFTMCHGGWKAMALAALDGSAGGCESFMGQVDADVLVHLANSAPLLKNLRVTSWPLIPDGKLITKIIKKLPLLECVVLWSGEFQKELLLALLDHCPRLKVLNASQAQPTFDILENPIATRIHSRSNIKHFRPPLAPYRDL